jgi:hypothetical protein
MRIFWRFIILGAILTSLFFSWPTIVSLFLPQFDQKNNEVSGPPIGSKVILAYPLTDQRWIEFLLFDSDQQIKLISNAELPLEYQPEVGERWQYAIEYELLSRSGTLIKKGEINHKTGQLIFSDQESNQNYVSAVYYPALVNPVDARLHLLNLRGQKDVSKIRIRLKSQNSPLVGVVARVYRQKMVSNNELNSEWQRLSADKKQSLSRASVYQKDLLRDIEKQRLVSNQWTPIGPSGVVGSDYESRKLYVARDVEEDIVVNLPAVAPNGLQVYPDIHGVIRIPVFSEKIKLTWQALEPLDEKDHVNVEWWGHPSTRYQNWKINASLGSFSQKLDSGVIRVNASKHLVFKVWSEHNKALVEITPKVSNVRLYKSNTTSVGYRVNHLNKDNTPFKIVLRTFEDLGEQKVSFRFFGEREQVLKQGELVVTNLKSDYDRLNLPVERSISDPSNYYFNLPRSVKRIEVFAENTVWIAAYTRPNNLAHLSRYPYKLENSTNQIKDPPGWFFVRPINWKEYVTKGLSSLLSVQPRPPEIDPILMEGQYHWESFIPTGNWRGRELLVAFDNKLVDSTSSAENKFKLILDASNLNSQLELESVVDFKGVEGEVLVTPELIFSQDQAEKLTITLWLDDKVHFQKTVYSRDGMLNLEPVKIGKQKIKIKLNKPADILIDQLAKVEKGYNKRTAIQLGDAPLVFNYLKQNSEELLAFRVFGEKDDVDPQKLTIRIKGNNNTDIGPFKSWTIKDKKYILEAGDGAHAKVLYAKNNLLGPAKLIFIQLGDDMPNNKSYKIEVELAQGEGGYLIMTRTIPGIFETREIKKQN